MHLRPSRVMHVEPVIPPQLERLRALTRNLYWTWNTEAVGLFESIDGRLWSESGHNPVRMLQALSPARLAELATDHSFLSRLEQVDEQFREYLEREPQTTVPGVSAAEPIAYFSLEFALTESLPNYSGGLGVLAGDHLKSASDLGLPLVGVGLLYHQGYFQQALAPDGWQHEEYHDIDLAAQPLRRVLSDSGLPLVVDVPFEGRAVKAAVWQIDVGRVPLYLLDTNLPTNSPVDRGISGRLYGGDIELRIQQEMLLGIGGIRALHAMGLDPAVCHMNEGHSALLGVERVRMLMEQSGASFEEARLPVTAATAFTTHTAVAAGIDLFPADLVRRHLGHYYAAMGVDPGTFIGLGRMNPTDESEPFSMALLGLRLAGYRNGVSKLHGTVSKQLWEGAWPSLPLQQVPIDSVTNGVHLPTWVSHDLGEIYDRYLGRHWRVEPTEPGIWDRIDDIPDGELWHAHEIQRERLIARARAQHREAVTSRGALSGLPLAGQSLHPRVLTIGFARRFAEYKRATLLFRDLDRLAKIVNNPDRPIQFIFAGKAHPKDEPAKQLIREVLQHSRLPEFRDRLVVLERYDVELARALVSGCDVWLNTPLRPLEASGTSGMKAVANGGLHLSVLDGWWWEAYTSGTGWAIGRDRIDDDPEVQDAFDANSLYELLESEVAESFYTRDTDGIPRDWVARMKRSIRHSAPNFNTNRMVSDYANKAYAPAAASWHILRRDSLAAAREQAEWLRRVTAAWHTVRVVSTMDDAGDETTSGSVVNVTVTINPGQLRPEDLRVDVLFGAAPPDADLDVRGVASLSFQQANEDGTCRFFGSFTPSEGGRSGFAIRVLPHSPNLHNPFAPGLALWG